MKIMAKNNISDVSIAMVFRALYKWDSPTCIIFGR